ncbi:hypothetical protein EV210_12334 [Anaerospora hongkongensis]|uniref:Uncharacterized protein n=1 Tax=Anaerospora hongkongensis TaxID=244830 RepID=A0A4R1PNF1_9FIRM|nr:hypothetical protein [Anaerospora hongkongensis]TCL32214.1 hypothetical protein EV210_12334 [Anaerospora hongkongensis]
MSATKENKIKLELYLTAEELAKIEYLADYLTESRRHKLPPSQHKFRVAKAKAAMTAIQAGYDAIIAQAEQMDLFKQQKVAQ